MLGKIGENQLANLCYRLGTGLRAGVDMRRVWEQEASRSMGAAIHHMKQVHCRVDQGDTLASSMRGCGGYFPPLVLEMIEVGETAGRLDEILLELSEHYKMRVELRRQFLSQITWPVIQLLLAICMIALLIVVMGILGLKFIFGLSGFGGAIKFLMFVAFVVSGIGMAVFAVIRGWAGPLPLIFAMKIPYLGACMQDFALARLARVLSMALDSGVDARRSIRLAIRASQKPYYVAQTQRVDDAILDGAEFHVALQQTRAFPSEFLHDLSTAEVSGTHSESMNHVASMYHERAKAASKVLTTIASFLI